MTRLAIITVGKTHSGKTTFARTLEKRLTNTVVVEQDNHAEFLNTHYKILIPKHGHNLIKHNITQTIIDYAIAHTNFNMILANANRSRKGRLSLLSKLHNAGFHTTIIYFNIPDVILETRVAQSVRSTNVMRKSSSFKELLVKQQAQDRELEDMNTPKQDEADYFFEIKNNEEIQSVIEDIIRIAGSL